MRTKEIALTFLLEPSEVDRFKDILTDENSTAADWTQDNNYVDYDIERKSATYTLFDVYFVTLEEAEAFVSIVNNVFQK